jgi:hypothetical protein
LTVECTATVANIVSGSQVWDGDGGVTTSGGGGSNQITLVYVEPGQHKVTITVTGVDGTTASASDDVDVLASRRAAVFTR